jgi:two-component system, NtrC family, response regulator
MKRFLLVDDDARLRLALSKALMRKGYDVLDLSSGESALDALRTGSLGGKHIDACVIDLRMPGMSGLDILRQTQQRVVPVIVLTGHGTVPDAVEAMRLGAVTFIQKPVDADELAPILEHAALQRDPSKTSTSDDTAVLGASAPMIDLFDRVDRAAKQDDAVLLIGEPGTGKELLARRLHHGSLRHTAPFVVIRPSYLPKDSLEAEVFGARRGADQGALLRAGAGTIFFDEVAELPLDAQAKLLKVIEEGRLHDRAFGARVVASSSRNLRSLVEAGRFMHELALQLAGVTLTVPPLRERGEDVVLLARAWLGRAAHERAQGRPLSLSSAAETALAAYRFPGNVRELISIMKRAALFSRTDEVSLELVQELIEESPFAVVEVPEPITVGAGPRAGERVTLEELERTHIKRLLDELHNVSEVARIVGIDRRTLQRKMIAWGLRSARGDDGEE